MLPSEVATRQRSFWLWESTLSPSGPRNWEDGAEGFPADRGDADMMGSWFVPPIVIPLGFLLLVLAIAVFQS